MKPWLEDTYWQRQQWIRIRENDSNMKVTSAASNLAAMPGVLNAEVQNGVIYVKYDLRQSDLSTIRSMILSRQLTIAENSWERLVRWISEYKEAVRREEQHVDLGWDAWIQAAYVNRYRLRRHGRRDDRVTNWRQYEDAAQTNNRENDAR